MDEPKSPTVIEQAAGHVLTQSVLTIISVISAGPLAALLPVLAGSLAAERQKARVELCLSEITSILSGHDQEIRNLSDEQYKIINETVLALFHTTEQEKLKYLRAIVANTLNVHDFKPQEATVLSRVVRDISAEEAEYVIRTFRYSGIHLMATEKGQEFSDNILRVDPHSRDAFIVGGLMSLGLLVPAEPTWNAPNVLRFSSIVVKLIVLLREPGA